MSKETNGANKKQTIKKVIIVCLCAIPVLLLLNFLLDRNWSEIFRNSGATDVKVEYKFATPDYDYDIFEDEKYLDKNRLIEYTDGAVSRLITDDPSLYGVGVEFFSDYFDAVINGDVDAYNAMFTDEYKKEHGAKSEFTMQKIYNITLEKLSENVIEEGAYKGVKRYTYRVTYMIMDNNGTFRSDMGSDAAVPQIIELLEDSDGAKINSITKYTHLS